ncbi:predicted protein [Chaetomium globosum CBS 148.51]|uniref:Secreted protein n=1 Tax=Chaetomium globosum (strain ATCC 6205 / CBS 148.51 / DSM 1962 / NBRC 6347 / NRRL 1970) TaxID=306901 RepID=Q2GX43_CHAGB|nr:uncharacterized protein CHGG_07461 [Chaetomium globosum CBS 148.51]EAQ86208.1 predicted protein [Chaetomium globosum CBS 148.51]
MKAFTLLTLAVPAVLGSPAPAPLADGIVAARGDNTSCNPYTDWGHTQGANGYYCHNFGDWPAPEDYHCVRYKSADYCSGKAYCSDANPCKGNGICRWGVCVEKVNGKQCQRTCDYGA